jgi:hypothetical protein
MPPIDPLPNQEEDLEKLNGDYATPFSLPDDASTDTIDPALDQNLLDQQELYDQNEPGEVGSPRRHPGTYEPGFPLEPKDDGFDTEPTSDDV